MNIPYHVMIIFWLSTPIFSHFLSAITFLSQTLNNKFKSSSLDLPPPLPLATFHQLPELFFGILMSWPHGPFVSTTLMASLYGQRQASLSSAIGLFSYNQAITRD